ncbi:hypothetical protein PPUN15366_06240 [Pseudomonas putida]|uniref:Uncharacterized protein n=1 Tax=Pseudomonas plecoglossicida TaxID=70775 RepID=A0A2R7UQT1_PSEDL|nr:MULTISPECIES: hypothetical protein [Pseudomonas putida group]PTU54040.1 hypothetical protein DBB42_01410 [Pseudomonas plecoglossicida]GLO38980.1 hypothetical protein PPUN15366_06240 [Pseudomonas putida]HDS0974538.1 hypothetical protein [Pseudomonas putida]
MAIDAVKKGFIEGLKFMNSPTSYLVDAFEESVKERPEPAGIDELRVETERRELEMRMSEAEARVAQELAIARRIETAYEVEMTEYFEYAGKGHVGVSAEGEAFSIGAGGSGRRVSKRKFVFKGHPDLAQIQGALERIQESAPAVENT